MRAISETTLLAGRVAYLPLAEVQQSLPVPMVETQAEPQRSPIVSEQPPWVPDEPPSVLPALTQAMQGQQTFLQLNEVVSRVPAGALATWFVKHLQPGQLDALLTAFPQFKS